MPPGPRPLSGSIPRTSFRFRPHWLWVLWPWPGLSPVSTLPAKPPCPSRSKRCERSNPVMVHDLVAQAYGAMRHNRRRTALTMLGMAWGIATVVLLLAYGAGFGRAIHNIFSNFGMQVMGIFPGRTSLQAGGAKAG